MFHWFKLLHLALYGISIELWKTLQQLNIFIFPLQNWKAKNQDKLKIEYNRMKFNREITRGKFARGKTK